MNNLLKYKYILLGILFGVVCLDAVAVIVLKKSNMLMHIEYISNCNQDIDNDSFYDLYKLAEIVPEKLLAADVSFEKDVRKTLNYVASIVDAGTKPTIILLHMES